MFVNVDSLHLCEGEKEREADGVCVCVIVFERKKDCQTDRHYVCVYVRVCVFVNVCV